MSTISMMRRLGIDFQSCCLSNSQLNYMFGDICLIVDTQDRVVSNASKKECHTVPHLGLPLLHRAFSLFLFRRRSDKQDGQVEMLMQRRSQFKLTYPGLWSNTCCSHPLANVPGETEEVGAVGVKRAAQRKLLHELGMDAASVLPLSHIHYLTRMIYHAPNITPGDPQWAEHELDYILVGILDAERQPKGDQQSTSERIEAADFTCNPEEVSQARWVGWHELHQQVEKEKDLLRNSFTPWFWRVFRQGYLGRIWTWVEAFSDVDRSCRFLHLDASWNRDAIIRLRS